VSTEAKKGEYEALGMVNDLSGGL